MIFYNFLRKNFMNWVMVLLIISLSISPVLVGLTIWFSFYKYYSTGFLRSQIFIVVNFNCECQKNLDSVL